jgi:hypothetical protein
MERIGPLRAPSRSQRLIADEMRLRLRLGISWDEVVPVRYGTVARSVYKDASSVGHTLGRGSARQSAEHRFSVLPNRVLRFAFGTFGSLAPPNLFALSPLRLNVSLADHLIFVNCEFLQRHRAAGV